MLRPFLLYLFCSALLLACREHASQPEPIAPHTPQVTPSIAPLLHEGDEPADPLVGGNESESLLGPDQGAVSMTPGRLHMAAAGDLILHDRVKSCALQRAAVTQAEPREAWTWLFEELRPGLTGLDFAVANLETPIASSRRKAQSFPVFFGPQACLDALAELGFDAMFTANNHSYDQKAEGLIESQQALAAAGLLWVGSGATREEAFAPRILQAKGLRVAIFAFTTHSNFLHNRESTMPWLNLYDEEQVLAAIGAVRGQVDGIIVGLHWGNEFEDAPNPEQRRIARTLCSAGADILLGSGPHLLQAVERQSSGFQTRSCVVAYSLGNLISNQGMAVSLSSAPERGRAMYSVASRQSVLLRFVMADEGIELGSLEAIALWTENNWTQQVSTPGRQADVVRLRRLSSLKAEAASPGWRRFFVQQEEDMKRRLGPLVRWVDPG